MEKLFDILKKTDTGIILNVKIVPNSSFNKITEFTENYIKIKISSPPVENRANMELISFCSEIFKVNKSKISIINGEKSKIKKILFKDADFEDISKKLLFMLDSIKR